jgi:hypothetical protein
MTIECALSDEAQPRQQGRVVIEAQDREIVGRIPGRESRQCAGPISAALRNAG